MTDIPQETLTAAERDEFETLASAYLDGLEQVAPHGMAVASGREPAGALLVTLMSQLMAKYPIAAFVCYGRLFHLIPHDGKQLLYVLPVKTICDLDAEEEQH
jgi:hypothetical protein